MRHQVRFLMILILQIRKPKLKEMQSLAQGHTISKWPQTPNLLDPKAQAFNHLLHRHTVIRCEFEEDVLGA